MPVRKKKLTRDSTSLPSHPTPDSDLADEISMLRDSIKQVFDLAADAQDPVETLRILETLGLTSVRLARLVKVQHELGQDVNEVDQAISDALDEIIKDWKLA